MAELLKFHKVLHENGNFFMEDEPESLLLTGKENFGGIVIFKEHIDCYSLYVLDKKRVLEKPAVT
ncbi:MAG: hypothetical protein NUV64_01285 [Parcubacteria group bacterium]|nr:hypothetical protein [Parcubacteria group bacterium]MCR4342993.1 hypothetical protein [Patescibacteria group bacterium]